MSCALNWINADAETAQDSTVVIPSKTTWVNQSAQTYFALPDSFARRLLSDALVCDQIDSLYAIEVQKTATLAKEKDGLNQTLWRDRLYGTIILIILIIIR